MEEQTIIQFSLLADGGPFVWLLLIIFAFGAVFIAERIIFLHRMHNDPESFVPGLQNNIRAGRIVEALKTCQGTAGPVARVCKAILLHYGEGEARMRFAAEEAALLEIPVLKRRSTSIATLAKVAPLVGFAGTVFALLRAFVLMKSAGHYASADIFSGDIASALTATGMGLVIAIIFYLGHAFLQNRLDAIAYDMELAAVTIIACITFEKADVPDSSAGELEPDEK